MRKFVHSADDASILWIRLEVGVLFLITPGCDFLLPTQTQHDITVGTSFSAPVGTFYFVVCIHHHFSYGFEEAHRYCILLS